jgi:hypothetical protein
MDLDCCGTKMIMCLSVFSNTSPHNVFAIRWCSIEPTILENVQNSPAKLMRSPTPISVPDEGGIIFVDGIIASRDPEA